MSDLDEGRDLHTAFGTLLAAEPAASWSVADDVTRGRALQRRRRTRAGAGIGLAAAAVMVFGVFGPLRPHAAVVVPPAVGEPAGTRPCAPDEVKIVPAVDSTGGATGERSFALEVYARNPGVSCTVDGFPSATLLVGSAPAPDLTYTSGDYGFPNVARGVAVGVDESNAAVFVIAKYRCDSGTVGRADKVMVTLPGSSEPVTVELPTGLAPELCAGGLADAGHEVWVSFFKPREGGVS